MAWAALALPLLDAMVPALTARQTEPKPARRFGVVYVPNGVFLPNFTGIIPKADGAASFELSPMLEPLAPFKEPDRGGRAASATRPRAEGRRGRRSRARHEPWLGRPAQAHRGRRCPRPAFRSIRSRRRVLGKDTPLPSLEMRLDLTYLVGNCGNGYSCVYVNTLALAVGDGAAADGEQPASGVRAALRRWRLIGAARRAGAREPQHPRLGLAEMARCSGGLAQRPGQGGRLPRLVREMERRIQAVEAQAQTTLPASSGRPGIPDRFDHARLADARPAAAGVPGRRHARRHLHARPRAELPSYPEIGITEGHHGLSHHGDNPDQMARYAKVNTYQAQLFALPGVTALDARR